MASKLRKSLWNSLLYSATNLPWFIPKISICRRCASDVQWHLNPFSSRHCFAQTWQYHRSFCKPLLFAAFAIALSDPLTESFFPIAGKPGARSAWAAACVNGDWL